MEKKGWLMLRVLINRYNPKAGNALFKFLPQDELQAVTAFDIDSSDLSPFLQHPRKSLEKIHYSWLKPLLENFSNDLRPVVGATLTSQQTSGLHITPAHDISDFVKTFFQKQLYLLLKIGEHFPPEYLPENEMTPLAKWTKQQLVNLIDFLGLHDLASEVRHIVNPNYLKNIYTCLTPKQFYYLKVCLHQKERIISPKLGIDPSKPDCPRLKQIIHRRGLIRLGKALCGQHPDFVWHLAHTLDMGRGTLLLKEYQTEALEKVTPILKQQVLNMMNFLKESF